MGMPRSQVNKAHKSRFASKSSRHVHKTSGADKDQISKAQKNVMKGARAVRIQRNKQVRDEKRAAVLKEKRVSSGLSCPPRVIVLFGLNSSVDLSSLARDLLTLSAADCMEVVTNTVASPTFRLRTTVLQACHGDLLSCMEMAKVADMIAFVVSGSSLYNGCEEGPIDSFGSQFLSVLRAMGLPSTAVLIRDLPDDMKKKQELKRICSYFTASELPEDCKVYLADTKEELSKFMWLFKEQHLSAPHWRTQRPYLLSHEIDVEPDGDECGKCSLILSGYVRAHKFSVNQLVHVSGVGDFQLSKIEVLRDPFPMNERRNRDFMDSDGSHAVQSLQVVRTLLPDPMKAEPLQVENVPDPLAGEQTWPTEAEMAEADATSKERKSKKKIVPYGTSDYQAAWIVGDMDDADSGYGEDEADGTVLDKEKNESMEHEGCDDSDLNEEHFDMKDFEDETEPDVMMADDETWTTEQIKAEILKVKEEHAEDEEFPDEVDTPLDVPARKCFAKYRGLKSFRTSSWDPKELLPQEYARIFAFDNFRRTQKYALAKVLETDQANLDESASIGSYVRLHIKQVPKDVVSQVCIRSQRVPVVASGLLQHESKMSVLHFSIRKYDLYDAPIKSKESFVFHVGFRQFTARPIFSSDNMNCDKHKMERFLHPGRFSIASVYAPVSFPPLHLIVLKNKEGMEPAVAAFGSLRSVDPDRIILKKIILSGYPQRVSKSKASVRFMFHNPDDVRWFKPVEIWTKCGRRGRIKEPVGTHGAMKCLFNGVVQQHDTVCMSLYKRVYPKWPEKLFSI